MRQLDDTQKHLLPRDPSAEWLEQDFARICAEAAWPKGSLRVQWRATKGKQCKAEIQRQAKVIVVLITAPEGERAATAYFALESLGFRFPHPRWQISPSWKEAHAKANSEVEWQARLRWRGFHLHTQHPNEWVHGFFMGKVEIARETIRWLVRNRQNLLQIQMLRSKGVDYANFRLLLEEAQAAGLQVGLSVSFGMIQQKSYTLLPLWRAFTGLARAASLKHGLKRLNDLQFDWLTVELGSSEFTALPYRKTLVWLNRLGKDLEDNGRALFVKIHASSNQHDAKLGNYNFLPEKADASVGVQVHTLFAYALEDEQAPMYGCENFKELEEFLLRQKKGKTWKRRTWYYPETSYFVAMDIDVPIFLTNYLSARFRDMAFLEKHGVEGQINFSTGQEMGYWLFDWAVAQSCGGVKQPLEVLEKLGEKRSVWKAILDYQDEYFFKKQLIRLLSSENGLDALPGMEPLHTRNLFKTLRKRPDLVEEEIKLLEKAMQKRPSLEGVELSELRHLLHVTWLRVEHAYWVRKSFQDEKYLKDAARIRKEAAKILRLVQKFERYPEANLHEKQQNPTSYQFGYVWPASTLHFWEREEEMIRANRFHPFFRNIYQFWRFLT